MKRYLLVGAFAATCLLQVRTAMAQTQLMSVEVDGVKTNRYGNFDVDGSPFLNENWISGTATSDKGENYQVNLKYDVIRDQPVFADKDNDIMVFTVPITRFTLEDDVYQNGFPAVDDWKQSTFYKVLGNGKAKLLKHYYKKKLDVRDIGGLSGYKYEDNIAYYVFKDGKMMSTKFNKNALIAALSDKKDQVETYIKTNKLDLKQDADLTKLMNYYSSL